MRQAKPPGPAPAVSAHPQWMKVTFAGVVLLFLALGFVIMEQYDDAKRDLAAKRREQKEKAEINANLRRDNENTVEFLTKYNNDAEFRDREARQRLGYTAPGEVVFRLDPPPKAEAPPAK